MKSSDSMSRFQYLRVGGKWMSILGSLKRVKKQLIANQHPLAEESIEFRKTYAVGYALLICVKGHPNEIAKDTFRKRVVQLNLPESFYKEALQTALNTTEETIHHVLKALNKPLFKYVFMLDLYCLAQQDHKMTEKEQEIIGLFEELLQLSYVEIQFIRGFRLAILKNDNELAVKVVQTAIDQEVNVPQNELSFFLPGFEYEERLLAMNLHSGQKRILQYKTLIKGEVVVGAGAELDLNGMEVRFSDGASIIVDGGVLKANGAKFTASLDANTTMLIIRNTASLSIEHATFNGANIVRAIEVSDSALQLMNCTFERCYHEERGGAVYVASGERFVARDCMFENCSSLGKGGTLYIAGSVANHMKGRGLFKRFAKDKEKKIQVILHTCHIKSGISDVGGGIYIYSAELELTNTTFEQCKGRAGAAALDAFNCTLNSGETAYIRCEAPPSYAVVMLKDTNVSTETQIGQFEQCEVINSIMH